jgi:uncharacterized CHY-type Zn-finger protein
VRGVGANERNQCIHYGSDRDIVAIRFKCCDTFYACFECHREIAGHEPVVWGRYEREARAVLCGACHSTLSIAEYLVCGNNCPICGAAFNPGCANHHPLYFESR